MRNLFFNGTMYGKNVCLKQINKTTAKKLYLQGEEIFLTPCKKKPITFWGSACPCTIDFENYNSKIELFFKYKNTELENSFKFPELENEFNMLINEFKYYNCNNEMGKYISFYVDIKNN